MKKIFCVLLFSILFTKMFAQNQSGFEIGAEWLNNPTNFSYELNSTDWNNISDLGLNWGMLSYHSIAIINTALDNADSKGVKTILDRGQLGNYAMGAALAVSPGRFLTIS